MMLMLYISIKALKIVCYYYYINFFFRAELLFESAGSSLKTSEKQVESLLANCFVFIRHHLKWEFHYNLMNYFYIFSLFCATIKEYKQIKSNANIPWKETRIYFFFSLFALIVCAWLVLVRLGWDLVRLILVSLYFSLVPQAAACICVFSRAGWRHAPSSVRPLLQDSATPAAAAVISIIFIRVPLYARRLYITFVFFFYSVMMLLLLLCTVTRDI